MISIKNENVFLTLAGFFTWALVVYVEVGQLINSPFIGYGIAGYLWFLLLFLPIATGHLDASNLRLGRTSLFLQLISAIGLIAFSHAPFGSIAPVLLVIWAGQLPDFFSRRTAFILVLISALLFFGAVTIFWKETYPITANLIYLGFQLFSLFSSFARVSERNAREHVEFLNQQLQATRILLAQSSRQGERVRIARDLHDILGHQLTALNLQLEFLQHKVPDELREQAQKSKNLAKELLENIRQVVRDQRTLLSLDIRQAVLALAAHIPQLEVHIEGDLRLESVQLAEQLVLCIQEGMSNALRHGSATKIVLSLNQQEQITLQLDDNGRGLHTSKHSGVGLQGMRERLSLYQGTVALSSLTQGCRLTITLNPNIANNTPKEIQHD